MHKLFFFIIIFLFTACGNGTLSQNTAEEYTNPMQIPFGGRANTAELYPIREGKLWGYINQHGKTVITPQYDSAGFFHNNRALVYKENQVTFNYVKQDGTLLFDRFVRGYGEEYTYNWACYYNKVKQRLIAIDTNNIVLSDTIISNLTSMNKGFANYLDDGNIIKYRIYPNDNLQKRAVPNIEKGNPHTNIKILPLHKNKTLYTAYLSNSNDTLFVKKGRGTVFRNGYAYILVNSSTNEGKTQYSYYINIKGDSIKNRPLDADSKYYENGFYFLGEPGGAQGLLSSKGDTLLSKIYRHILPCPNNEVFIVDKNGNNALFSANTKQWLTQWNYKNMIFIGSKNNFLLQSYKNNKYTYINKKGQVVWQER